MDEQILRKVVKEVIDEALVPIKEQLEDPETGLKRLNTRVDANSASLARIEKEIGVFGDAYKENQRNIEKLDTRLNVVEEELAINPPEELKVAHF